MGNFDRYFIIQNAIEKLADYEDMKDKGIAMDKVNFLWLLANEISKHITNVGEGKALMDAMKEKYYFN